MTHELQHCSSVTCPNCGSDLLGNAESPLNESTPRLTMACRFCGHEFQLSKDEELTLTKGRRAGDVIHDEMKCGSCGYILKSLKVGARCPECGDPIASIEVAPHWTDRILPWKHFDKIVFVVGAAALLILMTNRRPRRPALITFFVLIATVFLLIGLRGLKSGFLVLKPRFHEEKALTGRNARLGSLIPLAASLLFLTVAILILMNIIH